MTLATVFQPREDDYFFIPLISCPLTGYGMGNSIPLPHGIKSLCFGGVFQVVSLLATAIWYTHWELYPEKLNARSSLQVIADLVTTVAFVFFTTYALSSIRFSPLRFKSDFFLESGIKPNLNLFIITTVVFDWIGSLIIGI